jgi:hypothetical protein
MGLTPSDVLCRTPLGKGSGVFSFIIKKSASSKFLNSWLVKKFVVQRNLWTNKTYTQFFINKSRYFAENWKSSPVVYYCRRFLESLNESYGANPTVSLKEPSHQIAPSQQKPKSVSFSNVLQKSLPQMNPSEAMLDQIHNGVFSVLENITKDQLEVIYTLVDDEVMDVICHLNNFNINKILELYPKRKAKGKQDGTPQPYPLNHFKIPMSNTSSDEDPLLATISDVEIAAQQQLLDKAAANKKQSTLSSSSSSSSTFYTNSLKKHRVGGSDSTSSVPNQ